MWLDFHNGLFETKMRASCCQPIRWEVFEWVRWPVCGQLVGVSFETETLQTGFPEHSPFLPSLSLHIRSEPHVSFEWNCPQFSLTILPAAEHKAIVWLQNTRPLLWYRDSMALLLFLFSSSSVWQPRFSFTFVIWKYPPWLHYHAPVVLFQHWMKVLWGCNMKVSHEFLGETFL